MGRVRLGSGQLKFEPIRTGHTRVWPEQNSGWPEFRLTRICKTQIRPKFLLYKKWIVKWHAIRVNPYLTRSDPSPNFMYPNPTRFQKQVIWIYPNLTNLWQTHTQNYGSGSGSGSGAGLVFTGSTLDQYNINIIDREMSAENRVNWIWLIYHTTIYCNYFGKNFKKCDELILG